MALQCVVGKHTGFVAATEPHVIRQTPRRIAVKAQKRDTRVARALIYERLTHPAADVDQLAQPFKTGVGRSEWVGRRGILNA